MNDKLKLLYVEDDKNTREDFIEIFNKYFNNISVAEDGETALKIYEKDRHDIVILDIVLPNMDGLSVAKKIKDIDSTTEIIMMSAYSEHEMLLRAVNLQLFSYLLKPIRFEKLDKTLRNVTKKLQENSTIDLHYSYKWNTDEGKLYFNDNEIKISKNEAKMLAFLSTHKDKYYSACEIAYEILDNHSYDDLKCNNVVQLISRFKKKMLRMHKNERFFIENIYGLGYKINA